MITKGAATPTGADARTSGPWFDAAAQMGDRSPTAAASRSGPPRPDAPALRCAASTALLTDGAGRILNANRCAAEMLGYSEAQLLTLSLADIDPTLDPETLCRRNGALLADGVLRHESVARRRDGDEIAVEITQCVLEGGQPEQLVALCILTDITERKRAEAELQRHRCQLEALVEARTAALADALSRLKTATEAAELGLWEWDLTDNSAIWDARSFDIFGMPADQRRTAPDIAEWLARVHPEDRPGTEARIAQDLERMGRFRHGYRILLPDGGVRHILATGKVVRDGQGRPRRMVGFIQDVTEAREAELALRRSEERLESILYGTDAGTWAWELASDAVAFNERWAGMLGYTLAELVPHSIDTWKRLTHPDDLRKSMALLADCFARREPLYECELRMRHRDGHWVWILDKGRVVEWGPGGEALRMAGIHLDITDRKRAEAELREAKDAAEASAGAKGRFLAHMSHEIRTPMNGILGLAELALHRPLEPVARGYLEKLLRAGRDLLGILNDILDQSRVDAGQVKLHIAPFDLQELLGGLLDLFGELAADKGLRLVVGAAADVPRCLLGDVLRLRQVLANLIGNAIKFTQQGEVRLAVSCAGVHDGVARLAFAVSDTGPGIDAAGQARLFTPFAQGDASIARRGGGTGLGLSISRGLVDLMGGRLLLESAPGAGSTFTVELPLPVADAVPAAALPATPVDMHGVRVLVAEDHPVNRQVLADMLALLGVDATLVVNGREALAALARVPFDVVLMDIQMPEMDGLTAIARLRERPEWAALPVIAITAGVTETERTQVAAVGASDLLPKPVSLETLMDALIRWLPAMPAARSEPGAPTRQGVAPAAQAPAPLPPLPPLAGFDMQRLQKTLGHQQVAEFVQLFVDSTGDDMAAVERALDAGDVAAARRAVHSLRGACAFAGALAVDGSALRLSDALKQGEPADGPLASLRQAYGEAVAALAALCTGR
jgi:PAS domain S-box-containing protein